MKMNAGSESNKAPLPRGRAQSSATTTIFTFKPSAFAFSSAMPKFSLSPAIRNV